MLGPPQLVGVPIVVTSARLMVTEPTCTTGWPFDRVIPVTLPPMADSGVLRPPSMETMRYLYWPVGSTLDGANAALYWPGVRGPSGIWPSVLPLASVTSTAALPTGAAIV